MNTYGISIGMRFVFEPDVTDERFEEFLDQILDKFEGMDVETPDYTASVTGRTAAFEGIIKGDVFEDAVHKFASALRAALHGASCSTPNWPTFRVHDRVVRELEDA